MKKFLTLAALITAGTMTVQADLSYDFTSGLEGFENVSLVPSVPGWSGGQLIKQTHTTGGWQSQKTKEFAWGAGGGNDNQQTEMQRLANLGNARISFDVMVDGGSFPAATAGWFQLAVIGNSDGSAGWTQKENVFTASGWHNADDATLVSMHMDQPLSWLGWEPGDTWFQLWTVANSDAAVPVNFYFDNLKVYAVPEPTTFALLGLGALALFIRRK